VLRDINNRLFVGNSARDINAVGTFLRHVAGETPYSISLAKDLGARGTRGGAARAKSKRPVR
jgi:hypothetical protein